MSYILFSLTLYKGSRSIILLNYRPKTDLIDLLELDSEGNEEERISKSLLKKYKDRNTAFSDTSFLYFLLNFNYSTNK